MKPCVTRLAIVTQVWAQQPQPKNNITTQLSGSTSRRRHPREREAEDDNRLQQQQLGQTTRAVPGATLTAAQLLPEGGGRAARGGGRRAAVPALVSELAAALLEAETRSLPDGGHQLRLLPAQLLLPGAQRRAGAARFLRPPGGRDAQPPAEQPRQRRDRRTRAALPRSPNPPSPATHIHVPPAAPGQRASNIAARSRLRPRAAPRPMAAHRAPTRLRPPLGQPGPAGRAAGGEASGDLYSLQGEKVGLDAFPRAGPGSASPGRALAARGAGRAGAGSGELRTDPHRSAPLRTAARPSAPSFSSSGAEAPRGMLRECRRRGVCCRHWAAATSRTERKGKERWS